MHIRRPPPGDGPRIYRPNESVSSGLDQPSHQSAPVRGPAPVRGHAIGVLSHEPDSIPPEPRDTLLSRVNRRRGAILTTMVSIAAIASFASVVWWAHNQDVKAGGKGLEPLVVQAPATPARIKPENSGGFVPPNQDKEVYNRIAPGAVETKPEKLLAEATTPKLPANGVMPTPTAPKEPEVASKQPTPLQPTPASTSTGPTPPPAGATPPTSAAPASTAPANQPTVTQAPTPAPTESGPSIASLIDNMSGSSGGWRIQLASVKNEDIAKSTWAKLQAAHGDVLANLRLQPTRVDLGDKGVWYRVQAGPLDERQAQSVCGTLKGRKTDCVAVPPAR